MAKNVVYMCPITRKGYDNPYEPRLNYIQNLWSPTPNEIFEYCQLKDLIEYQKREKKTKNSSDTSVNP